MKPTFFRTQAAFRRWLEKHHASKSELIIGFYKKASGRGGLTYKPALDEALCFGWIDGVVRSIDADCYMQRFTPRKRDSHWSNVNVQRYAELEKAKLVTPAGRAAYERRTPERTGQMSFEQPPAMFSRAQQAAFKANRAAWEFFEGQPAGYKRQVTFWVTNAKQETTRDRRLAELIECSAKGERIPRLAPTAKKKPVP